MAMASVECASRLIEPKLIAPGAEALDDLGRRFDLVERMGCSAGFSSISPRIVSSRSDCSLIAAANSW